MVERRVLELMDIMGSFGVSDDDVEPMPCCGTPIRLGDHDFGTERLCAAGRCVEFVCLCGKTWASVGTEGCACAKKTA